MKREEHLRDIEIKGFDGSPINVKNPNFLKKDFTLSKTKKILVDVFEDISDCSK
jgi:hypothetical protein